MWGYQILKYPWNEYWDPCINPWMAFVMILFGNPGKLIQKRIDRAFSPLSNVPSLLALGFNAIWRKSTSTRAAPNHLSSEMFDVCFDILIDFLV